MLVSVSDDICVWTLFRMVEPTTVSMLWAASHSGRINTIYLPQQTNSV